MRFVFAGKGSFLPSCLPSLAHSSIIKTDELDQLLARAPNTQDGVWLNALPREVEELVMAMGSRVDVAVKCYNTNQIVTVASTSLTGAYGLDYDIFFMESVVEYYDAGCDARTAVVRGLEETGQTICVAGVIMFLAFGPLVMGSSPTLNQIGYLLCVGVLLDCFVTTKVIIPSAMALFPGSANFWPRRPAKHSHATTAMETFTTP